MSKPEPTFTIDDLLAELNAADMPEGVTVRELCVRAGMVPIKKNIGKVGRLVHDQVAMGTWEFVGKKEMITLAGDTRGVPAYRPKEGE